MTVFHVSKVCIQYDSIGSIPAFDLPDGFVDLTHWKVLSDGCDPVLRRESQHFVHDTPGSTEISGQRSLSQQQEEHRDRDGLREESDEMQFPVRCEELDDLVPVQGNAHRYDDQVEFSREGSPTVHVFTGHDGCGAEPFYFLKFSGGVRKCRDFGAPGCGELEREMAEAADAENPDLTGRPDVQLHQRCKDSYAGAHQGTGVTAIQFFRDGHCPDPMRPYSFR